MVFFIWTGLVEAGMLVVGCARRVENIEKLASQLTQNTGKVTQFCTFNPVIFSGEDCVDQLLCFEPGV
jgi:hypothetical protein